MNFNLDTIVSRTKPVKARKWKDRGARDFRWFSRNPVSASNATSRLRFVAPFWTISIYSFHLSTTTSRFPRFYRINFCLFRSLKLIEIMERFSLYSSPIEFCSRFLRGRVAVNKKEGVKYFETNLRSGNYFRYINNIIQMILVVRNMCTYRWISNSEGYH